MCPLPVASSMAFMIYMYSICILWRSSSYSELDARPMYYIFQFRKGFFFYPSSAVGASGIPLDHLSSLISISGARARARDLNENRLRFFIRKFRDNNNNKLQY